MLAGDFTLESLPRLVDEALAEARAAVAERDEALAVLERMNALRGDRLRAMAQQECDLGNALVHQKNRLLALCNDGRYEQALDLLEFVAESWQAAGYGYKAREIRDRVRAEARAALDGLGPKQRKGRALLGAVLARVDGFRSEVVR